MAQLANGRVRLAVPLAAGLTVLTLTGMSASPTVLTPGAVVHAVYETIEPPRLEPGDPYHLPMAALTPPRRVTEQWTLVSASGAEQSAYFVVRDEHGTVTQQAHRSTDTGTEQTWWPASNQAWRETITGSFRVLQWEPQQLGALGQEGYRETGTTTVAGRPGRVFERNLHDANGGQVVRRLTVATNPEGLTLGEQILVISPTGQSTTAFEMALRFWEVLPPGSGPSELRAWIPPPGARVTDPKAPRAGRAPSLVGSFDALRRVAPFRLPKPASPWAPASVFYAAPSPNALDSGLFSDIERSGAAASVTYRQPGLDSVAYKVVGPRDAVRARLRRTPAEWETAQLVVVTVSGTPTTVWLASSSTPSPPPPADDLRGTSPRPARPPLIAMADLDDVFVVVRFYNADQAVALDFLRNLSADPA